MIKIIPFGERILVKRKKIGGTLGAAGLIVAPDETAERSTDLAVVVHIPDQSFADLALIQEAEDIIIALTKKAKDGDSSALESLLKYNEFIKIKSIKVGDEVMVSKYVGTNFYATGTADELTLVNPHDIIGLIVHDKKQEEKCQIMGKK